LGSFCQIVLPKNVAEKAAGNVAEKAVGMLAEKEPGNVAEKAVGMWPKKAAGNLAEKSGWKRWTAKRLRKSQSKTRNRQ
jgi:hypothetical protein